MFKEKNGVEISPAEVLGVEINGPTLCEASSNKLTRIV
jgi:hypothetical protein